jgi:hypothetical protein
LRRSTRRVSIKGEKMARKPEQKKTTKKMDNTDEPVKRQKKIPIEIKVIPVRPAGLSLLTAKIRKILANISWNKNPK